MGSHAAERRPSNARSGCRCCAEARLHHGALRRTGQHAFCGRDCGEVKGRRGRGGRHGGASALASSAPTLTLIHLRFGLHRIHRHGEIGYRSTQGSHNCCKGSKHKESGHIQMKSTSWRTARRLCKSTLRLALGRQPLSRCTSVILRNKSRGLGLEVGLEQVEHALRLNIRHPATDRSGRRWRSNGWVDGSCSSLRGVSSVRRDSGQGSKPAERQRRRARGHGDGPCVQIGTCCSDLHDVGGRAQAQWLFYYLYGAPVVRTPTYPTWPEAQARHLHASPGNAVAVTWVGTDRTASSPPPPTPPTPPVARIDRARIPALTCDRRCGR